MKDNGPLGVGVTVAFTVRSYYCFDCFLCGGSSHPEVANGTFRVAGGDIILLCGGWLQRPPAQIDKFDGKSVN